MTTEKTFSAKQVASRIGTDAKTLRKFFRAKNTDYKAVGQGARYEFPESQLDTIRKDFQAWQKGKRYPSAREREQTSSLVPPKSKIPEQTARGRELMERFPSLAGESVIERSQRVGRILAQERIDKRLCGRCMHPFGDHWESKEMQQLRPRSAKSKTGCSRDGCWCTKLQDTLPTVKT